MVGQPYLAEMIGIFCSGSRGGYIGVLFSVAVFVAVWSIRKAVDNKASLAPAIVGLTGVSSFTFLIGLILCSGRERIILFLGAAMLQPATRALCAVGCGDSAYSVEPDHRARFRGRGLRYQQFDRQLRPLGSA